MGFVKLKVYSMKILHKWSYKHRIVYLTQLGDKFQLFYRSSGLAGYSTKGEVFPILRLKDNIEMSPDGFGRWNSFGWLPKLYVYNGHFQEYRYKRIEEFPENMHPYMKQLEETDDSDAILEPDPRVINKVCNKYIINKMDYVDWNLL